MNVIVVDDGVNEAFVGISSLSVNIEVTTKREVIERKGYDSSEPSHGSVCARIIHTYFKECQIGSIKILDDNDKTGRNEQLLVALEWCLQQNIKVVNLSLGTKSLPYYKKFRRLVNELSSRGCIIVNSCNIRDVFSMPSCFPGVIGVGTDYRYISGQYQYNAPSVLGKDISASSRHNIGLREYTSYSTSYAAPLITARVCEFLSTDNSLNICDMKAIFAKQRNQKANYCLMPPNGNIPIVIYSGKSGKLSRVLPEDSCFVNLDIEREYRLQNHRDIIVVSREEISFTELVLRFLNQNKRYIRSVTYCNNIPRSVKEYITHSMCCFLWYEDIYKEYSFDTYGSEYNVPIIGIKDDEEESSRQIERLKMEFLDNGYRAVSISDKKYSYLGEADFYCKKIDHKIHAYVEQYYEADLILESSSSMEHYCDILIELSGNTSRNFLIRDRVAEEYATSGDSKAITISTNYYEDHIKDVVKRIEEVFNSIS